MLRLIPEQRMLFLLMSNADADDSPRFAAGNNSGAFAILFGV
jgi:hypothetical protein